MAQEIVNLSSTALKCLLCRPSLVPVAKLRSGLNETKFYQDSGFADTGRGDKSLSLCSFKNPVIFSVATQGPSPSSSFNRAVSEWQWAAKTPT